MDTIIAVESFEFRECNKQRHEIKVKVNLAKTVKLFYDKLEALTY